jgi:hypothetical protein
VSVLPEPPLAVARQLDAYNRRDLAAFVACYAESVVLEDGASGIFVRCRSELEARYGALFRDHPENRATVSNRSVALPWVFEEELVERDRIEPDGQRVPTRRRVLVVYRLEGELIARAIFFRGD